MRCFLCPQCAYDMQTVQVTSHYGRPFVVEQCSRCGGMWFDTFEHHRVTAGDVSRLDALDESQLRTVIEAVPVAQHCPKDAAPLMLFSDPHFPKDVLVETCATCGGLWFNRGEFTAYRAYYKKKWPKKEPSGPHTALLARAFLSMDQAHEVAARERAVQVALTKESLKSLVTFLIAKPVGVLQLGMLYVLPFWVMLTKLFGDEELERAHVNMDEFRALVEEGERTE